MYSDLPHETYQRLHDAAKLQAQALRRQAISDFWHQAARVFHALRRPEVLRLPREA